MPTSVITCLYSGVSVTITSVTRSVITAKRWMRKKVTDIECITWFRCCYHSAPYPSRTFKGQYYTSTSISPTKVAIHNFSVLFAVRTSVFSVLCYLLDVAAAVAACRSFSTFGLDFVVKMEWDWHQFFCISWFSIIWHACFCFSVFLNSEFLVIPACQLPPCAVLHIVLPFFPLCFSNWKYKSCVFFFWGVWIMCSHLRMVIV